jgi:hypothetical protein
VLEHSSGLAVRTWTSGRMRIHSSLPRPMSVMVRRPCKPIQQRCPAAVLYLRKRGCGREGQHSSARDVSGTPLRFNFNTNFWFVFSKLPICASVSAHEAKPQPGCQHEMSSAESKSGACVHCVRRSNGCVFMSDGQPLTVAVVSKKVRSLLSSPRRWWQHQLTRYRERPNESRRKVSRESLSAQLAPLLQAQALCKLFVC